MLLFTTAVVKFLDKIYFYNSVSYLLMLIVCRHNVSICGHLFQLLCSVIAGLMHFFFLAAFAWMCLEGVQLYVLLIQVFSSDYSQAVYFYLFGYGFPSIIVAVSAIVFPSGYGTEH